ncbi:hypothetical protein Nepgr_008764 [Nepenthes gracilis]|uniref:Uncharacterized protein n=1 Tax=Nepenthes gracilis TaxID=150966 RepID=A0AAD3SA33_NEPGR|nr:hypothetical protein Nepgr_008764 [Nepenthes gracilis]
MVEGMTTRSKSMEESIAGLKETTVALQHQSESIVTTLRHHSEALLLTLLSMNNCSSLCQKSFIPLLESKLTIDPQ